VFLNKEKNMEFTLPLMDYLKVDQVAIIVKDVEKVTKQLSSLWKLEPFRFIEQDIPDSILHGKKMPLKAKLAFTRFGPVELEIIQPGEGESIYREFLNNKGEGIHHFGLLVSDIECEIAKFRGRGIGVLQSGETPRVRFAYMDTESSTGMIIELLQRKQNQVG
jgi:methylmalonyl-CoA/ethylmalonyl-CoA epimerase